MAKNNFERFLGPEDHLHKAIIDYITLKYGRYRKFLAHPSNEGRRSPFEQFKIVYLGVSAGLPDLMIFLPRGKYHGLAIEVKAKGNKPTEKQFTWLDSLENHCGWMARWTDNIEDGIKIVDLYFQEKPYQFSDEKKPPEESALPHRQ